MANGNGYKLFGTETVSSAEAMGYWMRQVVSSHVDLSARTGAITAVPEGHIAVDRDTNRLWIGEVTDQWVPFGSYGEWDTTFSPTLYATTTNPTMGTGPTNACRFMRHGTHCVAHMYIKFGTSMAAGSGIYEMDVPVDLAADLSVSDEQIVGWGIAKDDSTGQVYSVVARAISATRVRFEVHGATGDMDNTTPLTWGDSDIVFNGTLSYETEIGP